MPEDVKVSPTVVAIAKFENGNYGLRIHEFKNNSEFVTEETFTSVYDLLEAVKTVMV